MSDELKACPVPWCESDVLELLWSPFGHNHRVKCQNCGASGPAMIDKAAAIAAWNRRTLPTTPDAVEAVTNGTVDREHYGPIGDAARRIASYCEGNARVHVYTAAFDEITAALSAARPFIAAECAMVAAEYGPSRPRANPFVSIIQAGRWEGEQAASANIAIRIKETIR